MKITEQSTIKVLNLLRAPKANLGFQYLIDALRIISNNTSRLGMTTTLYREIAMANNTTSSRVERCIRHEITSTFSREYNNSEWESIVGYPKSTEKVTNKEFIASLYWYLKNSPESR